MARPPKHPAERRAFDLRVPVTEEQRRTIERAVAMTPDGQFSAWARAVLLQAAQEVIAGDKDQNGKVRRSRQVF